MDEIITPEAPRVYSIPQENLAAFQDRIARLQKRAAKLNSGLITVTEVGYEDHLGYYVGSNPKKLVYVAPGVSLSERFGAYTQVEFSGFVRRYTKFTIEGTAPVLNGWRFLGSLEVIFDEEAKFLGNAIRCVPGESMPERFRTAAVWCDHCKTNRRWKSTFVVQHEDGRAMQIGRNCLKDFTGHATPEHIAAYAEYLIEISELGNCAEDDGWGMGGGDGQPRRFNVENVLERTACVVRNDGWKPAVFEERSTKSTLMGWYFAKTDQELRRYAAYEISDYDRTTAHEALEWMQGLADAEKSNDYLYNLSILSRAGTIDLRSLGFLASGISAYLRAYDRLQTILREKVVSKFVGEPKKRQELVLTLRVARYYEGDYGTRTMMKFCDDAGNVVIWWASGSNEMARGTKIRAKATVKSHEEYEGVKQTKVSRLTVLETLIDPTVKEEKEMVS